MKKILTFVLLVSFISGAGLMFSGCSSDSKKKIIDPEIPSFEGTWKIVHGVGHTEAFKFTGSNVIKVYENAGVYASRKATFTYDENESELTVNWTHTSTEDALAGDVSWTVVSIAPDIYPYSFSGGNVLTLSGTSYNKI